MKNTFLTSEKILDYIRKNPGSSSTVIAKQFHVTPVAIFYHMRELVKENKIEVHWKSRATRYFIKITFVVPFDIIPILDAIRHDLEDTYKNTDHLDIESLLRDILLILLPDGEWRNGIDAIYEIIKKENQWNPPSEDLFSRRLHAFLSAYFDEEQKRRKNGFFDGTESIRYNLEKYDENCFVDRVYFCEINKLWHWGKLRAWAELYHGKSLQDKKLLISAIDKTILRIQKFFLNKWVDGILLTPPTLPRKVQFRDVFFDQFGGITSVIPAEKIKDKDFRPQKELHWKDRFINARASIQVNIPKYIWTLKHIVIIDDNFTTGATVNAIAEKLRIAGFSWEITVITVMGNFWYVPWVTDAEEI